jgi:hypothetical protein
MCKSLVPPDPRVRIRSSCQPPSTMTLEGGEAEGRGTCLSGVTFALLESTEGK